MKDFPKQKRITKPAQHLTFIRSLSCMKCGNIKGSAYQFDNNPELSLPICYDCQTDRIQTYPMFRSESEARSLARNLCLLSGNIYACINVIMNKKEGFFL